ncbi:MAG: hypothetical protein R3F05_20430 [Planctomycetota bacterium]
MDHPIPPHFRRATLPEILFSPDLALALGGVTPSAARRAVLRGECGPYLRLGRRIAVRREAFLAALAEREQEAPSTDERNGAGEVE